VEQEVTDLLRDGWRAEAGKRLLPYDLFKWWGRRPALLIDALLLDAIGKDNDINVMNVIKNRLNYKPLQLLNSFVVCDPMCGGGTTAVEALFLGASKVICSDINPVSGLIIKAMIKIFKNCEEIFSTFLSAVKKVYNELKDLWCISDQCYVHTFLTRKCSENYCYAPRWLGSYRLRNNIVKIVIDENGKLYEDNNVNIRDLVKLPKNKLVKIRENVYAYAVELYSVDDRIKRRFVSIMENELLAEHLRDSQKVAERFFSEKCTPINNGRETRRLITSGIRCWEQIFTPRQLLTLLKFLEYINIEADEFLDVALALVGTLIRTSSILAFYYQPYAKVNPGLVIKSFWLPPYPVELNPLAGEINMIKTVGRGTIITYLRKLKHICDKSNVLKDSDINKVIVKVQDAMNMNYSNCHIVILDPPYPGKIIYDEITQIYIIPQYLLKIQIKHPKSSFINIHNLSSYTLYLKKLILKIFYEAPQATIYLMMSNDNKGKTVSDILIKSVKEKNILVEKLGTAVSEAPGTLGRSMTKEIIIFKMKMLPNYNKKI
jgi:16S rRNA G966 N2-methylase RsmD